MNDHSRSFQLLIERAEDYRATTVALFKLKAIDKSAEAISSVIPHLAVVIMIGLSGLIMSIGVALWIGELLGKSYYGFFIVAGCYGLITVLIHGFRNQWIKNPVRNSIISQMRKESQE
jgi:hypothetical protein